MPEFLPFQGVRFSAPTGSDLTDVVAPPYDILSADEVEALYAKSEHNVVRLDFGIGGRGADSDWHADAGRLYADWRTSGILTDDPRPCFYVLKQEFARSDGSAHSIVGVIGACRLTPWEEGAVLPHEHTFSKPKGDRLRLMRETCANMSQIYSFYSDPDKEVDQTLDSVVSEPPVAWAVDADGVRHSLWLVDEPEKQREISRAIGRTSAYIADGHHRYETALAYRDETVGRDGDPMDGRQFVMMYMVNLDAGGITILPTHRLIKGSVPDVGAIARALEPWYDCNLERSGASEGLARANQQVSEASGSMAYYAGGGAWLWLRPKDREALTSHIGGGASPAVKRLTVTALHEVALPEGFGIDRSRQGAGEAIEYLRDAGEGVRRVDAGEAGGLVVVPAPTAMDVKAVAEAGDVMPHKSTYFYPKLLTGLVINDLGRRLGGL